MWEESLAGIKKHLITYSARANFTILAERSHGLTGKLEPKMDHLVCFMPGTLALAATGGLTVADAVAKGAMNAKSVHDLTLAKELIKTCVGMYKVTATGLAPEITYFDIDDPPRMMAERELKSVVDFSAPEDAPGREAEWKKDFIIKSGDTHNLQRPETVESLFYMWRITGDEIYRQWGWEIFEAFVKHTTVADGASFSSINNVNDVEHTNWRDNMESFWPVSQYSFLSYLWLSD
jgi:mannosyl-oligosaccharide alpha-1,2-mannosidase